MLPLDSDLIDRARLGHPDAQEMLLRTLSPRLLNLVHRLGCDPSTGEELVSEAMYKGLVKLDKLKKNQAILPWFQRILVNLFRDHLRKKKPKDSFLEDVQEPEAPLQDQPIPRLEAVELKDKLEEAISRLPTRQRVTLSLHYECELDQSEIAEVLETSIESVKMNLHHARKRLMALLGKENHGNEIQGKARKSPPNESTKC